MTILARRRGRLGTVRVRCWLNGADRRLRSSRRLGRQRLALDERKNRPNQRDRKQLEKWSGGTEANRTDEDGVWVQLFADHGDRWSILCRHAQHSAKAIRHVA